MVLFLFGFEYLGAHHRSGAEGNQQGDHDRCTQGHREFTEQPSHDSAHHQNRNEDCDQ